VPSSLRQRVCGTSKWRAEKESVMRVPITTTQPLVPTAADKSMSTPAALQRSLVAGVDVGTVQATADEVMTAHLQRTKPDEISGKIYHGRTRTYKSVSQATSAAVGGRRIRRRSRAMASLLPGLLTSGTEHASTLAASILRRARYSSGIAVASHIALPIKRQLQFEIANKICGVTCVGLFEPVMTHPHAG